MPLNIYNIIGLSIILLFSIILSVQDIKSRSVNVYLQIAAISSALIFQIIVRRGIPWIYILAAFILGSFYFLIKLITRNKLGSADILFGFFQGLFLTPFFLPVCLGLEAITALCLSIRKDKNKAFAFIPFMSFGLLFSYLLQISGLLNF